MTEGPWQQFTSEKYGFTVLMPVAPNERVETVETARGPIVCRSFVSETGSVAFGVIWNQYPTNTHLEKFNSQMVEKLFDASRDGVLGKDGKLIREHATSYQNYPGREIEITKLNGQAHITMRVYLIGPETMSLTALVPRPYNDNKSVPRFLDSFQLIGSSTNK